MPASRYDAVADTRPRVLRDVLFTETPDGVLFHNADGGFRLTAGSGYRFAKLLVPYFNGEHTVTEICQGFGDRQRAMVGELVSTLYERGFARAVEPEGAADSAPSADVARRFEAQIAYVEHYTDGAARRFQTFRDTRVAVVGTGPVARWCVLSLIRNGSAAIGVQPGLGREQITREAAEASEDGCPVQVRELVVPQDGPGGLTWDVLGDYDVVVVTDGSDAARTVFRLLSAGIPAGRTVIPAWSFGRHAVLGPSMSSRTTGCWVCAVLRLGAGDAAGPAADVWSGLALDGPAAAPVPGGQLDGPLAAMLGNQLGYEVFRTATGALPAETAGQLIIQDSESLDVTSEPLLPHPRCPWCADGAASAPVEVDLTVPDMQEAAGLPTADTAREADALVEELNRRSVLVRPHAGVFTRFDDESLTQTPLKLSVVELGLGHGRTRRIAAADVHHVAGARMRALYRAAEVYAEHVVPHARADEGEPAGRVAPDGLSTATGLGGTPADGHPWVTASSLLTKERFLVPGAAVRPSGSDNTARIFEATAAGLRAGPSATEAAKQGLLSALAHDALLQTVRGRRTPRIAPPGDTDPELTFLMRSAANLGLDVQLLDLGEQEHSGTAVALARAGTRWTQAAGLSWRSAAVAALRDLLGAHQLEQQGRAEFASFGEPELSDFDPRTLTAATTGSAAAEPDTTDWAGVLARLGEQGRDALVVPMGSADLERAGIHVVRVLLTSEAGHAG